VGLTLCPRVAIAADLAAGRLAALPWAGFEAAQEAAPAPPEAAILMIRHADKWCSPLLARFMDLCVEVMGRTAPSPTPGAGATPGARS
jgi:DNA-binding transcriptional LysR family regulator